MLLQQVQSIYWQDDPSLLQLHPRLHLYTAHLHPDNPHVISHLSDGLLIYSLLWLNVAPYYVHFQQNSLFFY